MAKNITEFNIEWGETDAAGIVFYPNYFRWFDRATHTLFKSIGLPISELTTKYGYAHPIVDSGCRFFSPLRYDDQVRLETTVVEVRERTFKLEHQVFKQDQLVGSGYEVRAWVKNEGEGKIKAIPIPPDMSEKLKAE